jgi:hypothetical protein
MTRIAYAAPLVLLLTLCLGCNYYQAADKRLADSTMTAGPMPAPNPEGVQKIVKTAELRMEVKDFGQFTRRLHDAVQQMSGYFSQEDQTESTTEISNSVMIKLPASKFDSLLLRLPADSDRLVAKKISSQELEPATEKVALPGHAAASSTINLHFYQVFAPAPPAEKPSFARRLTDAFGYGWDGFSEALFGVVRVWPLLISVGLVVYGIRRLLHGIRVKPAVVQPQEIEK